MKNEKLILNAVDYVIIGTTLCVSSGIGLYFQLTRKKKTNEEYLLAGKDMSVLPVAFSLMASFMSSTTFMGIPAEMYLYGTNMAFMNLGFIIGPVISSYVFLPIFFANDVSTAYEYLEKRFGKTARRLISAMFAFQALLFTAASLYAPALALSAVTNLSMTMSVVVLGVVCTFYCTLGGMKAVLWTDVFQAILMFAALFVIIIKGLLLLGGIRNIFEIAKEGGRLIIPRFTLDPEVHYSMFNVFAQGMIITMSEYAGSQIQVQRLRTLKNLNKSKLAAFLSIPMLVSFQLFCCFCGLIIYVYFRSCDPLTSPVSPIESADQVLTRVDSCCFKSKFYRKDLIDELKIFGMSSRHHIDNFMRGRIIGKIEEGRKITDVAREFNIAHSLVSRLWKSFKTTGMYSRRHGGGCVRCTTPAEDRYIVLSAKRNRRTTAQQVANQFLAASGKQISRKTVARRLRGGRLYARRPVVCVLLIRQHRTAHLQWCLEHHNWTEQDWACVLFSDESRFSLSSDCRRQLIWRESGTAYRPENIQEKDRYPTCSIMV
ncbi:putative sodium-dependent multivitamin transporter [Trichonephila clavipes]|nr:putative sodium-dependent multivitamin transporter [Trichonephila clavipes]